MISARTEIKLRINTLLEQIYPEYEKIFIDKYGSSSLAILEKYLLPKNLP